MLTSPFAFYRGAAAVMAADLATTPVTGIRTQLCGDSHCLNFGGFGSPERSLVFDVNDFDETYPGPWEWDVKRLAASFAIAGRESGYSNKERRATILASVRSYREAMIGFAQQTNLAVWYSRIDSSELAARFKEEAGKKVVKRLEQRAAKAEAKDSMRAFNKLTHLVDGEPRFISDPPLIVPIEELLPHGQHFDLLRWMHSAFGRYTRTIQSDRRHLVEEYRLVHVARKVVGVGSVGTRAWIALLLGMDDDDPLILQVKEAQESVIAPHANKIRYSNKAGKHRFANQGDRVVYGQRLMQATSDILLGWDRIEGLDGIERDFYVRQLWDWKLSANVGNLSPSGMSLYAEACGWTLARAHARSGDRIAIASYLGNSAKFDEAIEYFAEAYADQNERDYAALQEAVKTGRIKAEEGV
jgi:uncharacterized protein (DUF2252 family)